MVSWFRSQGWSHVLGLGSLFWAWCQVSKTDTLHFAAIFWPLQTLAFMAGSSDSWLQNSSFSILLLLALGQVFLDSHCFSSVCLTSLSIGAVLLWHLCRINFFQPAHFFGLISLIASFRFLAAGLKLELLVLRGTFRGFPCPGLKILHGVCHPPITVFLKSLWKQWVRLI